MADNTTPPLQLLDSGTDGYRDAETGVCVVPAAPTAPEDQQPPAETDSTRPG